MSVYVCIFVGLLEILRCNFWGLSHGAVHCWTFWCRLRMCWSVKNGTYYLY